MSTVPDSDRASSELSPRVRLMRGQEVSLGCGSLILIALIVLFFGRSGTGNLESEVHNLQSNVQELKKEVQAQTAQIKALRDKLEKAKGKE